MSKTWFCSGWFGLYLTPAPRLFVGVEDCFRVELVLALLLLAILCGLIQCCGELSRLNSSDCSCVLVFLCSWWLTQWSLPMNELGFGSKRLYMMPSCSLWSTALACHFGDSVCVCAACTQPCEQAVCVCRQMLCTWTWNLSVAWISSAAWSYPLHFLYLLTCQVALPLGLILVLLCFVQGIKNITQWRWRSSDSRPSDDFLVEFKIGSILVLFFLFSFIFQFLQFL